MTDEQRNDYVRAALTLQGYRFNGLREESRVQAVMQQFARIAVIAEAILAVDLPVDSEPASIFRP